MLLDAVSFAWSAGWVLAIGGREPAAVQRARQPLRQEIGAGLRLVLGQPVLRALAAFSATTVLFMSLERAIEVPFLVRTLHQSAASVGLLFTLAGGGAVLGGLAAGPLLRRVGRTRVMLGTAVTGNAVQLLIPVSAPGPRLAFFVAGAGVSALCIVIFNVATLTYRQTLCPDHLLGRMNATMRFLTWGTLPLGSLLGGGLATALGLCPTLWISAIGSTLAIWWLRDIRAGAAGPRPAR